MNAIKKLWWVVALSVIGACYWPEGQCWDPDDPPGGVGTGAGGGPIIPGGTGGFGEAPNEPLADDGYVPCTRTAECAVMWEADSVVCKDKVPPGVCTTFYQGQHSTLEEAKATCERIYGVGGGKSGAISCGFCEWATDPVERCKRICDEQYEKCVKPCKTQACYAACMDVYKECLRKCGK